MKEVNAAAAAKLLQSCLTLCDPTDGSLPGSTLPGILQARIPEWVAISLSNACRHAKSLQSCLTLWPYGQQQPSSLLCPQDSTGKNTGVGCHFLLQKKVNTHPFIFLFGKGENVHYWLSSPKIKGMWWEKKNYLWNLCVYIYKPGRLGSFLWHSLDYLGLLKSQRLTQWWDQCKDGRKFSQVYSEI